MVRPFSATIAAVCSGKDALVEVGHELPTLDSLTRLGTAMVRAEGFEPLS